MSQLYAGLVVYKLQVLLISSDNNHSIRLSYSLNVQVTALQLSEQKGKQLQLSLKNECKAKVCYSFQLARLLHKCVEYPMGQKVSNVHITDL